MNISNLSSPGTIENTGEFAIQWQKIHSLRVAIWGLRSEVQQQRTLLRTKQYARAAIDDKDMQLARLQESERISGTKHAENRWRKLEEILQDSEEARAEYGPLEDDCNLLEDQL